MGKESTNQLSREVFREIISLAKLAPSVHNTQPWKVQQDEATPSLLHVYVDTEHVLDDGDPTSRQTIISLGIFCEAIDVAANSFGYTGQIQFDDHSATISLRQGKKDIQPVVALKSRSSDRSIYKKTAIPSSLDAALTNIAIKGTHVWLSTDSDDIQLTADLTSKGIALALSNPSFRDELSDLLVYPHSNQKRGISVRSLSIPLPLAYLEPYLMKLGIGTGKEAKLEKKRWESASGIVFITAKGDAPKYWFDAGRVYLRASLVIEQADFSQATSAAIVEASNFHEDAEAMLGTSDRILCVLRIGEGLEKRHYSPRVATETLIASNEQSS